MSIVGGSAPAALATSPKFDGNEPRVHEIESVALHRSTTLCQNSSRLAAPSLRARSRYSLSVAGNAGAQPQTITVRRLTLTLCNTDYTGYCGSITRPVDPRGVTPGTLSVGFEYYPRSDVAHPSLGTILPRRREDRDIRRPARAIIIWRSSMPCATGAMC